MFVDDVRSGKGKCQYITGGMKYKPCIHADMVDVSYICMIWV